MTEIWDCNNRHALSLPSIRDFTALNVINTSMSTWGDILFGPDGVQETVLWEQDVANKPLSRTEATLCSRLPPSLISLTLMETDLDRGLELWDSGKLEDLISKRHEALPNLKFIHYVEIEPGNGKIIYDNFDTMVGRANTNDDGFWFDVLDLMDNYNAKQDNPFTTDQEPRRVSHYTQWKVDRYVSENLRPTWRDAGMYCWTQHKTTVEVGD